MTWKRQDSPQLKPGSPPGAAYADDVHHAREIVGKHVQRHLGGDLRQPLHQEVRRAHPHLERAERVLDRLAALTHGLGFSSRRLLHRLQYMLVLPAGDATLLARRAAVLDRAGAARIGPVAPQLLPVLSFT